MDHTSAKDDELDVAIVGGGVSGLYAAWRLLADAKETGDHRRVAVYEGGDRLSGRLLSVTPPGVPGTRVELGGMRYTSSHRRVAALVDHFKLAKDHFPVSQPENIAYVRGELLRTQDLSNAALIPYNLAPDERGADALDQGFTAFAAQRVLRTALGKNVPLDKVDWSSVARTARYEGKPFQDLPMQYVLQRSISEEAFHFAQDTSGYNSILHTWNAADGLPWNLADFGHKVDFFHLHDGFEALPQTIAAHIREDGGAIHLEHKLESFEVAPLRDGSPGIALHFVDDEPAHRPLMVRKLVLAMPRRSLELLGSTGTILTSARTLIESVEPIPLFKLALCYSYPWWKTLEPVPVNEGSGGVKPVRITKGQSITDLPVRQCYYWATDEKTQNSVVLIYDDGTDLDFWAGLRDRKRNESFRINVEASIANQASPGWHKHQAPRLMVEEAHRQMLIMHGATDRVDIPKPYAAAYRDWGEDPFGGGANFWRVGVDSGEVFDRILQPETSIPVYICGEAYSNFQGWVEGALETAEAMLQRHFSLKQPDWLKAASDVDQSP